MAMQFLKGLTRWFHFGKTEAKSTPAKVEACGHVVVRSNGVETHYPPSGGIAVECLYKPSVTSRRNFLFGLGAVGVVAAMPEIPLGRVWSFPRIISTIHAYPGRIDMLNLDAWEKYPWPCGAQSVALQLEKVRAQLPILYETNNSNFFALMERDMVMYGGSERISARSMRIPLISDAEIHDYATNGVPLRGTTYDLIEVDVDALKAVDRYPQVLSGNIPPAGDDFDGFDASRYSTAWEQAWEQRARRNGEFWREQLVPIPPAGDDCVVIPNLKTEAGKVSRLVDRYGDALAEKVDRTVVKPVRDELESICDLVNNA